MSTRDEPLMQLCAMPLHGVGTVTAIEAEGGACTLRTPQGEHVARQAASCLLVPQQGDRVWFAGDLEQGLYVTAILERADPASEALVRLPHGALEVAAGALSLRADALHLVGRAQLTVQAESAALCVGKLTGVGREASWSFDRVKLIADLVETFAERLIQFARWSQRTVDGIDQLRARQIDYRAEQTMQLQAENLVANASKLVKADGDQIHLG